MKKLFILIIISFISVSFSCNFDIGDWDISKNESSKSNKNAFTEINFLEKTYPLIFGTSTNWKFAD
jgi:hypothetical protein